MKWLRYTSWVGVLVGCLLVAYLVSIGKFGVEAEEWLFKWQSLAGALVTLVGAVVALIAAIMVVDATRDSAASEIAAASEQTLAAKLQTLAMQELDQRQRADDVQRAAVQLDIGCSVLSDHLDVVDQEALRGKTTVFMPDLWNSLIDLPLGYVMRSQDHAGIVPVEVMKAYSALVSRAEYMKRTPLADYDQLLSRNRALRDAIEFLRQRVAADTVFGLQGIQRSQTIEQTMTSTAIDLPMTQP